MIFLPKCRALCVDLEKGHGAGEKGMALVKRAWRSAIVKVARGNTICCQLCPAARNMDSSLSTGLCGWSMGEFWLLGLYNHSF